MINKLAKEISIDEWVTDDQVFNGRLDLVRMMTLEEKKKIIVIEVFQVNCPGCFLYGIPEAIQVYEAFKDQDVCVVGMATAFEDFDLNSKENVKKFIETGELVGETRKALGKSHWKTKIPFPVCIDKMIPNPKASMANEEFVMEFLGSRIPGFFSKPEAFQKESIQSVMNHLKGDIPATFTEYQLQGTPSVIIIDKKGIVRHINIGSNGDIGYIVAELLQES